MKPDNQEELNPQSPLHDLPLSEKQADETKGGTGTHASGGGGGAGKVIFQDLHFTT